MHRRDFLSTSTGAAAALAVTAQASAICEASPSGAAPAEGLSRARFTAWLNTRFSVRPPGTMRSQRVTLVAVEDGPHAPGLEQFHVLFRGTGPAATGFCRLRHDTGSVLSLQLEGAGGAAALGLSRATFSLITAERGAA